MARLAGLHVTPVQLAPRRREHHAQHRLAVFDQRDVDREFVALAHELARAIERIDEEETLGDRRHLARGHGFFGDDRHAGRDGREIREDDFLRGFVGRGDRRASALSRTEKSVAYTAMMAPPARCAV